MNKVMTHVVAGYPDTERCVELMRGMEKAGASMLEVQIPFSDPIADGETIMRANDVALRQEITAAASFDLIVEAALAIDVYVMSYFQKVRHVGIDKFCGLAAKAGAKGLIIPDLPFDAPEFTDFLNIIQQYGLAYVPVVSPDMSEDRLQNSLANASQLVYLTSMKGITGKSFTDNDQLSSAAENIKRLKPGIRLAIGFGVASSDDLKKVLAIADIAVIGSAIIRKIDSDGPETAVNFVRELASS